MLKNELYTKNQAIGYAVVALYTLKSSNSEVTEKELANEIPAIMKLYNPNKIIEKANEILKKNNKNCK